MSTGHTNSNNYRVTMNQKKGVEPSNSTPYRKPILKQPSLLFTRSCIARILWHIQSSIRINNRLRYRENRIS